MTLPGVKRPTQRRPCSWAGVKPHLLNIKMQSILRKEGKAASEQYCKLETTAHRVGMFDDQIHVDKIENEMPKPNQGVENISQLGITESEKESRCPPSAKVLQRTGDTITTQTDAQLAHQKVRK